MKIIFNSLAMALNLTLMMMHLVAARSLPRSGQMIEDYMMKHRETKSAKISGVTQFQTELAELFLPSYLKDMYINLTFPNGVARSSSNLEEIKANTIQSYKSQAKNAACGFYKFDVHEDKTNGEEIVKAELHLLQKKLETLSDDHYDVDIYHLHNKSSHQSPLQLSFKNIDSTPGWKKFDITPIVLSWKLGLINHGLQIKLTKGKQKLSCEEVFSQGDEDPMSTEPFLIVFSNDYDSTFFKHMLKEERKSLKSHNATTTQPQERKRNAGNVQNVGCHRKKFVVTTDSLSTGDIHLFLPKSFDAGVCEGHCKKLQPSPRTDHAHILSLYYRNNVDLSEVPSKCCVPVSYKKINIMFYNAAKGEHIIKHNMLAQVDECDCL